MRDERLEDVEARHRVSWGAAHLRPLLVDMFSPFNPLYGLASFTIQMLMLPSYGSGIREQIFSVVRSAN